MGVEDAAMMFVELDLNERKWKEISKQLTKCFQLRGKMGQEIELCQDTTGYRSGVCHLEVGCY